MWDSTAIGWADGGKQSNLIEWLFELSKVDILDAVELNRFGMVRRLLEANPSLANAPKGKGAALRYAAFKNNLKMAKLLLEFDADPTLRNENGHSALDYAEKSNDQEMIQLLTAAAQRKSGQ